MNAQNFTTELDQELLSIGISNELFFDENCELEDELYEVEGADDAFNEMSYEDFTKITSEEEKLNTPLYFKSVPSENTVSKPYPLGA